MRAGLGQCGGAWGRSQRASACPGLCRNPWPPARLLRALVALFRAPRTTRTFGYILFGWSVLQHPSFRAAFSRGSRLGGQNHAVNGAPPR